MDVLIAVLHIVGASVVSMAIGFAFLLLGAWIQQRSHKRGIEEACIALGIPLNGLDDPAHLPQIIQYAAAKFSSELLRNRISDLLGIVLAAWGVLAFLVELAVLAWISWLTFSTLQAAVYAWSTVAIAVLASMVSLVVALCCKVLTGRFPGQARQAQKIIATTLDANARKARLGSLYGQLCDMTADTLAILEQVAQRGDLELEADEAEAFMDIRDTCAAQLPGLEKESPVLDRYYKNHVALMRYVLGETDPDAPREAVIANAVELIHRFQAVQYSSDPIAVMERKLATGHSI